MHRLIVFIPIWLINFILIELPLTLLGWILVPLAAACRAYEPYQGHDGAGTPRTQYRFTWKFMFIWDNFEDGIADTTYFKSDSMFIQIVYWSCVRNPTGNLRATPLTCHVDKDKIKYIGSLPNGMINQYDTSIPQHFLVWQGLLFSNLYVQFNMFGGLWRFWIGNAKLYPTDINGITDTSPRRLGTGSVLQFKRIK